MVKTRDGLNIPEKLIRRKQLRNNILLTNPNLSFAQAEKRVTDTQHLNNTIEVETLNLANKLFGWEYPAHDGAVI